MRIESRPSLGKEAVGEELVTALRESPVFSALKLEELVAVAGTAKVQDFDPNQIIVNEASAQALVQQYPPGASSPC